MQAMWTAFMVRSIKPWDYAWRSAAYYQVALIDARRGDYLRAIEHCEASLDNRLHNKAITLKNLASQKIGHSCNEELYALLQRDLRSLGALGKWGTSIFAEQSRNDAQLFLMLPMTLLKLVVMLMRRNYCSGIMSQ